MAETIQNFLTDYYSIAIPLSILINIIISLLGVIPSIFDRYKHTALWCNKRNHDFDRR